MSDTSPIIRPYPADIKKVNITDSFFAPYIDLIRTVTVKDVFKKFISDGAIENYERVARGESGGHAGPPWYHGLICEVIRGVSDMLAVSYDAETDAELDKMIDAIRRAQSDDGWLHPFDTLMRPDMVWGLNGGDAIYQHETYNSGCMIEAGVHHYKATGKTSLLEGSVKIANFLVERIGEPPKWNISSEHSLAESALISLERLFADEPSLADSLNAKPGEYLKLAEFFINNKGNHKNRHQFPPFLREYAQDHRPGKEQREAVGHAVRATLFYTGIAEAAADSADPGLVEASCAIWHDITETKLHINGSVGAMHNQERFGQQYELPNNAYLETCAGVGLLFFAAAMFLLTGEASVWETAENTICNLLPAAVSDDGTHYTYENPLESRGGIERWSWHPCPCCPPMLLKAVGELPSYVFSCDDDNIWVNLYIDAEARLGGAEVALRSAKKGKSLFVDASSAKKLRIRIPSWAYDFSLGVPYENDKGYAVISLPAGKSEISINYTLKAEKIAAHPWVASDRDKVAVKYGPVLYCLEKEADDFSELDIELDGSEPVMQENGLITVKTTDGASVELIEYRRWNNHGPLPMSVWMRQHGYKSDTHALNGWEGKLYRRYTEING